MNNDTTKPQQDWEEELKEIMGYHENYREFVSYDWTPYLKIKSFIATQRQQAAEEATRKERERCLECVGEGWGNMILTKEITSNVSQQISDEIHHIFTKSIYEIRDKIKNG